MSRPRVSDLIQRFREAPPRPRSERTPIQHSALSVSQSSAPMTHQQQVESEDELLNRSYEAYEVATASTSAAYNIMNGFTGMATSANNSNTSAPFSAARGTVHERGLSSTGGQHQQAGGVENDDVLARAMAVIESSRKLFQQGLLQGLPPLLPHSSAPTPGDTSGHARTPGPDPASSLPPQQAEERPSSLSVSFSAAMEAMKRAGEQASTHHAHSLHGPHLYPPTYTQAQAQGQGQGQGQTALPGWEITPMPPPFSSSSRSGGPGLGLGLEGVIALLDAPWLGELSPPRARAQNRAHLLQPPSTQQPQQLQQQQSAAAQAQEEEQRELDALLNHPPPHASPHHHRLSDVTILSQGGGEAGGAGAVELSLIHAQSAHAVPVRPTPPLPDPVQAATALSEELLGTLYATVESIRMEDPAVTVARLRRRLALLDEKALPVLAPYLPPHPPPAPAPAPAQAPQGYQYGAGAGSSSSSRGTSSGASSASAGGGGAGPRTPARPPSLPSSATLPPPAPPGPIQSLPPTPAGPGGRGYYVSPPHEAQGRGRVGEEGREEEGEHSCLRLDESTGGGASTSLPLLSSSLLSPSSSSSSSSDSSTDSSSSSSSSEEAEAGGTGKDKGADSMRVIVAGTGGGPVHAQPALPSSSSWPTSSLQPPPPAPAAAAPAAAAAVQVPPLLAKLRAARALAGRA